MAEVETVVNGETVWCNEISGPSIQSKQKNLQNEEKSVVRKHKRLNYQFWKQWLHSPPTNATPRELDNSTDMPQFMYFRYRSHSANLCVHWNSTQISLPPHTRTHARTHARARAHTHTHKFFFSFFFSFVFPCII